MSLYGGFGQVFDIGAINSERRAFIYFAGIERQTRSCQCFCQTVRMSDF